MCSVNPVHLVNPVNNRLARGREIGKAEERFAIVAFLAVGLLTQLI
jgi:hypothetical protein